MQTGSKIKYCSRCGFGIDAHNQYCRHCGRRLPPVTERANTDSGRVFFKDRTANAMNNCPHCQAMVPITAHFCKLCGNHLTDDYSAPLVNGTAKLQYSVPKRGHLKQEYHLRPGSNYMLDPWSAASRWLLIFSGIIMLIGSFLPLIYGIPKTSILSPVIIREIPLFLLVPLLAIGFLAVGCVLAFAKPRLGFALNLFLLALASPFTLAAVASLLFFSRLSQILATTPFSFAYMPEIKAGIGLFLLIIGSIAALISTSVMLSRISRFLPHT